MNKKIETKNPKGRVGDFDVFPDRNVIRKNNSDISVEPRVMDVLCALIQASGNVISREALIEKYWKTVYGADESLTRIISRLRKTFREAGENEAYIETISKRGYRLVQPCVWFDADSNSAGDLENSSTVSLGVEAGAQEAFGNEGSNEKLGFLSRIQISILERKWRFALGSMFALVLVLALGPRAVTSYSFPDSVSNSPEYERFSKNAAAIIDPNSIAVLPFVDLSATGDQAYFSDGISEEILNVLSRVDGLKVASRTSSFQFKEQKNVGIPAIANQLRVNYVLQGSVRKAGNSIRITTQLIDANSDQQLWSSTFNRTLSTENIFAIQEEIAMAIVDSLNAQIKTSIGKSPSINVKTSSVSAYESYLKARTYYQNRVSFDLSENLLAQAVTFDSNFADAWAMRSAVYAVVFAYAPNFGDDIQSDRAQSRVYAQRALEIDPDNVLALASLALTDMLDLLEGKGDKTFDDVMLALNAALKVDPKSIDVLNWRGVQMQRAGYIDLGIADHARCIEVDEASAACRYNLMSGLAIQGREDETLDALYDALDHGSFGQDTLILLVLSEIQRRDLFLFAGSGIPQLRGWSRFGDLYDALQSPDEDHVGLRAQLSEIFESNNISQLAADLLMSALGDEDAGTVGAVWWFDTHKSFRQTETFKQQIKDVGIYDFWKVHGFPPQCEPLEQDDFICS